MARALAAFLEDAHAARLERFLRYAQITAIAPGTAPASVPAGLSRQPRGAEQRVNFTALAQFYANETRAVAIALGKGVEDVVAAVRKAALKPNALRNPNAIRNLGTSGRQMAKARKALEQALQGAYERGLSDAGREVGHAAHIIHRLTEGFRDDKFKFARIGPGLVGGKARSFFLNKSFYVTGILEDDIVAQAQARLFQALKGDKTDRQLAFELDEALNQYLPENDSMGRVTNVPARLETIARTNLAEAVNEGRWALFSDPEVQDVLEGLQYSAILDDRVRANHAAWDGVTLAVNDPTWFGPPDRRPPNGFQCRCLLAPVLVGSNQELTDHADLPSVEVADDGFK